MSESHQVRRIIEMLTLLTSGHHLTTSELAERIAQRVEGKKVSRRQIQRDIRAIEQGGIPIHSEQDGREYRHWIPASYRSMVPVSITRNEVLAVHILKGMLRQFRGTSVEADVDKLAARLEKVVPGSVLFDADLVNEVTPGVLATPVSDHVLDMVINGIRDVAWDRITYRALHDDVERTFVVALCRLIVHAGRLYVAAWHPKYRHYITMAVDRIVYVERATDVVMPFHVFDENLYRSTRFGVYSGKVRPITLRIAPKAARFFQERLWHPTQRFVVKRDGSLHLHLKAPINPELIAWIVSWADVMRPLSPQTLLTACKEKVRSLQQGMEDADG